MYTSRREQRHREIQQRMYQQTRRSSEVLMKREPENLDQRLNQRRRASESLLNHSYMNDSRPFNRECLCIIDYFKDRDPEFMHALLNTMKLEVYLPGQEICRQGEIGDTMYFLHHGNVEVLGGPLEDRIAELKDGSIFGDNEFFEGVAWKATVRAITVSDCRVIHRAAFDACLKQFPTERQYFQQLESSLRAALDSMSISPAMRQRCSSIAQKIRRAVKSKTPSSSACQPRSDVLDDANNPHAIEASIRPDLEVQSSSTYELRPQNFENLAEGRPPSPKASGDVPCRVSHENQSFMDQRVNSARCSPRLKLQQIQVECAQKDTPRMAVAFGGSETPTNKLLDVIDRARMAAVAVPPSTQPQAGHNTYPNIEKPAERDMLLRSQAARRMLSKSQAAPLQINTARPSGSLHEDSVPSVVPSAQLESMHTRQAQYVKPQLEKAPFTSRVARQSSHPVEVTAPEKGSQFDDEGKRSKIQPIHETPPGTPVTSKRRNSSMAAGHWRCSSKSVSRMSARRISSKDILGA